MTEPRPGKAGSGPLVGPELVLLADRQFGAKPHRVKHRTGKPVLCPLDPASCPGQCERPQGLALGSCRGQHLLLSRRSHLVWQMHLCHPHS